MNKGDTSVRRKRPFRDPGKLALIVCEGNKTEPNYFHEIRKLRRLSSLSVEIVQGKTAGNHPKLLVDYAKRARAKLKKQGLNYDQIWCVFDRDAHEGIDLAFDNAKRNGIEIAFSNPSFEIWLLLHFTLRTAYIDRNAALSQVKKYILGYEKKMEGVYGKLISRLSAAKQNADALRKFHIKNQNPETENPSTTVDKLTSYLENFAS